MRDKELYTTILGICSPWTVVDVELSAKAEEVRVLIGGWDQVRLAS